MINNSSEIDNENEMKNNDIIPVTRYECEEVFTYCDCLLTYVVCWDFFDEFVKTKQTKQNHCFVAVPVENAASKCYIKEKDKKQKTDVNETISQSTDIVVCQSCFS